MRLNQCDEFVAREIIAIRGGEQGARYGMSARISVAGMYRIRPPAQTHFAEQGLAYARPNIARLQDKGVDGLHERPRVSGREKRGEPKVAIAISQQGGAVLLINLFH
jgi:hypothetical protein